MMKKMTVVLVSGCLLSGAMFLTGGSVLGQEDKDQIAAPQNPAADKAADKPADKGADKAAAQGGNQRQGQRQGPGNFDPQKMQQQFMDSIKETLSVTDEDWNTMKPLIEKVMTLSRELRSQGRMGFTGGRRGGPGGTEQQPTTDAGKAIQALKTTLDNANSTPEEIKASLDAVRAVKKKSEGDLAKAKEELLKAITPRQEGRLVQLGIID